MRALAVRHLKDAYPLVVTQIPSGHSQIIADQSLPPRDEMIDAAFGLLLAPDQSVGEQSPHGLGELRLLARRELIVLFGKCGKRHRLNFRSGIWDSGSMFSAKRNL